MRVFLCIFVTLCISLTQVHSRQLLCRGGQAECALKAAKRYGETSGHHPPPAPSLPGTSYSKEVLEQILDEKVKLKASAEAWSLSSNAPPGLEFEKQKIELAITNLQAELGTSGDVSSLGKPQDMVSSSSAQSQTEEQEPIASDGISMLSVLLPLTFGGICGAVLIHLYRGHVGN
ncbi:hypothetical protein CYMTET_7619 [Cymbomonas tetramitiformis]|uniref:Uncharacterized protein n=1 Tax=Cymbomonas tetramitiformis TaxID=36881 RepID=A0AAE0GUT1_9CHLO|nr:hypothetical protein CYMTET_7619 [Cymbomonas tetramitiformis]